MATSLMIGTVKLVTDRISVNALAMNAQSIDIDMNVGYINRPE